MSDTTAPRGERQGVIVGPHADSHELYVFCPRCERWSVLDLEQMIRAGQGERRLPITARCSECGAVGTLQVRPPMPAWTGSTWMSAP